jgi:putative transposase
VYARVLLDLYARGARGRSNEGGQTGMVTALQRAGSGLNVNLHFHTLVLDGVFKEGDAGALECPPAPAPGDAEVAAVLATVRSTRRSRVGPDEEARCGRTPCPPRRR